MLMLSEYDRKRISKHKTDRKLAKGNLPWVCKVCGVEENLEVHHKYPSRPAGDINNLIVLCSNCHRRYHELYQLRKIAKSRLELYYGKEVLSIGKVFFEKLDILKGTDTSFDIIEIMEPHMQSYILLRTLISNWMLPLPSLPAKIHESFIIIEKLKQDLQKQKDWKRLVRSLTNIKSQLQTLLEPRFDT